MQDEKYLALFFALVYIYYRILVTQFDRSKEMSCKNSYFQLIVGDYGVAMKYYPPVDGGETLKIDEVIEYLGTQHIEHYDVKKINETILTAQSPVKITISDEKIHPIDELMKVKVTPDKMYAIARFYPPSEGKKRADADEFERDLKALKITNGIVYAALNKHEEEPEYCKNIVVAMGKKPVQGKNASIEYKFQTDKKAKPRLNEDGTVDFHHLDNISHVSKGDVLAVLTKEDPGEPGTDIYGAVVRPAKVERMTLKHGNNIQISEDGLKLISMVDGHVTLEGDRVFVSDNYDVPADVDNSTGDIEYNGSVTIKGNVRTGFSVNAHGNVEIFGVVEGANIYADGNIILHRGIQGMGKGKLVCKGNLVSKFIENAEVQAEGYIETDTILHSNVDAKGDIYVRGKNGNIIGGKVRSKTLIEATRIGSTMGTATEVEVGTDPAVANRVNELKVLISEKTAEREKNDQVLKLLRKKQDMGMLEPEKKALLPSLTKNIVLIDSDVKKMTDEYNELTALLAENINAKIQAVSDVYAGVKVSIAGEFILIHENQSHIRFKKQKGEITGSSY